MKNAYLKSILFLLIMFSLIGMAWAGDSVTLAISCIIPAIPGVNAPLLSEEKNLQKDATVKPQEELTQVTERKDETRQNLAAIEKGDGKNQFFLSEEKTESGIVRTIYSR